MRRTCLPKMALVELLSCSETSNSFRLLPDRLPITWIGIKHSITCFHLVYSSSSSNRSSTLRQWQLLGTAPITPTGLLPTCPQLLYPTSHMFAGPPPSKVCLAHHVCKRDLMMLSSNYILSFPLVLDSWKF